MIDIYIDTYPYQVLATGQSVVQSFSQIQFQVQISIGVQTFLYLYTYHDYMSLKNKTG